MKPTMTALLASALLVACGGAQDAAPDTVANWAQIKQSGTLRVLTRNAGTTYYLDRDNQIAGPEVDLIEGFADAEGLTVDWVVKPSIAAALDGLAAGQGAIAAAGLTVTEARNARFAHARPYAETAQQVVCRRGQPLPKDVGTLVDKKIAVPAQTSYVDALKAAQEKLPELAFVEVKEIGTERLLHQVAQGKIDCTIADAHIVSVNRRFLPELAVAFDLTEAQPLAWYVPQDAGALEHALSAWLKSEAGERLVARVEEHYYSYIGEFDYVDLRALNRRLDERLPKFKPLFEKAADAHELEPDLLAAIAYQESQWNPQAKSPTGVRGIMMLTKNTAKSLGVDDRLDPKQAIPAGAEYVDKMRDRLPDEITEPDRTWIALACYNLGYAHVADARKLALKLGKNPNRWVELREVLPLLTDKKYYADLKYGYARGMEPVMYVKRIRNYQDVIEPQF